jgi:hypothetical protein
VSFAVTVEGQIVLRKERSAASANKLARMAFALMSKKTRYTAA